MVNPNKKRIFATLESATLPMEQRTRAELFVYVRMEYTNPPLGTATLLGVNGFFRLVSLYNNLFSRFARLVLNINVH